MKRPVIYGVIGVVVVALVVAAVAFLPGFLLRRTAAQAAGRYDAALVQATSQVDANALAGTATQKEIQRVYSYLMLFQQRHTRLQSELLSLKVLNAHRDGQRILAQVSEKWRYAEVDATTGKPASAPQEEVRTLNYVLVRSDGNWIVDSALFADSTSSGTQ